MIAFERYSPFPFSATNAPLESPPNAYELLKMEMVHFGDNVYEKTGNLPWATEMHVEACRIIFASEIPYFKSNMDQVTPSAGTSYDSWLRDMVMFADDIVKRARLSPLRSPSESRLAVLNIIGKDNIFDACPLERHLLQYVEENKGQVITDSALQYEACQALRKAESESKETGNIVATWLIELANSSTAWIQAFRKRVGLPIMGDMRVSVAPAQAYTRVDAFTKQYNELNRRLAFYVDTLKRHGMQPNDASLRQQFLRIIDEFDDADWRQEVARNQGWLGRFKRRNMPWTSWGAHKHSQPQSHVYGQPRSDSPIPGPDPGLDPRPPKPDSPVGSGRAESGDSPIIGNPKRGYYFLNDPNFDRLVARELARWVAATMSPHNPNQHVPTDEELQHQARWIMFEDGDPWNQTSADNKEWLRRFKLDVGILDNSVSERCKIGGSLTLYGTSTQSQ